MKKMLAAAVVAIVGTGLLPAAAWADAPSDEASFVNRINSLRIGQGLPELQIDAGLQAKARAWAQTMADRNTIWHSVLADGITAPWQRLGENVGMGGDVDSLHLAFVASPHHYENLVNPSFRWIGLGIVRDGSGTLFVAEEFMQTFASPAPIAGGVSAPVKAQPAKTTRPARKAPVKKAPVKKAPVKPARKGRPAAKGRRR
jgi:uncharacterized protein YkwD